ncbi:MAG TPA: hypothetical protein VHB48_05275 [Chitinophagaceae bacterium]|nr:hypothetical protein [Chitinophagaceae bacterium]
MYPAGESVLKVVAYFDLFDYPVTLEEIKFFLDQPFAEEQLFEELRKLVKANMLYWLNGFYSLRADYQLAERRLQGNRAAAKALKRASKIAGFLTWFPYIRGVAVSGSLSKKFAYKGSDIDFFIITERNRLWTARLVFLSFWYVARLVGLKRWFCLNYYIDTGAAEIPEKNIYTAIEIATLIPKRGKNCLADFYRQNEWVYNYLPNYKPSVETIKDNRRGILAVLIEWLLNNSAGNALEKFICNFFHKRWKRMLAENRYAKNGFHLGSYIAEAHVCKPMPHYFQSKLLKRLDEKMKELDKKLIILQKADV